MAFTIAAGSMAVMPGSALAATTFTVNSTTDAADLNLADTRCDTSAATGRQCTLRAAIQEANDTAGADTIEFNIPGTATTKVISPASVLPAITGTVTINGFTQPGARKNTKTVGNNAVLKVVLNGGIVGDGINGLNVEASDSLVRGLVIQGFDGAGVAVSGARNKIRGNFIGTDATGKEARGNGTGVVITGPDAVVGGTGPKARNLISANSMFGVRVFGLQATGALLQGNYIGTRKGGTLALGNGSDGVNINSSTGSTIGGTLAGARNVISGNGGSGLVVQGIFNGGGPTVQGNFIGTDATGTLDLGNAGFGVHLAGTSDTTIGGTVAAARNVISGNGLDGIQIAGFRNFVQGNFIGTDVTGNAALGNSGSGVVTFTRDNTIGGTVAGARNVISANALHGVMIGPNGTNATNNTVQGNSIGARASGVQDLGNGGQGVELLGPGNFIGGAGAGGNVIVDNKANGIRIAGGFATGNEVRGNLIRLNDLQGVRVEFGPNAVLGNAIHMNGDHGVRVSATAPGVRISGNQILDNTALGINLVGGTEDGFGTTANDTDDPDTGANGLQNFPVLTSAIRSNSSGVTVVVGSLNSNPSTQFSIELFLVDADASGHGEAAVLLATQTITTDAGGDKGFSFPITATSPGHMLTATATASAAGSTSEFSLNVTVVAGP